MKETLKILKKGLSEKLSDAVKSDTFQYAILGAVFGLTLGMLVGFPELTIAGLFVGLWKGLTA